MHRMGAAFWGCAEQAPIRVGPLANSVGAGATGPSARSGADGDAIASVRRLDLWRGGRDHRDRAQDLVGLAGVLVWEAAWRAECDAGNLPLDRRSTPV